MRKIFGAVARELGEHVLRAAEDRLDADQGAVALGEVDDVGDDRGVEADRQATGDVAAVVGRAEEDRVGAAALDRSGDGRGDRHARRASRRGRRWRAPWWRRGRPARSRRPRRHHR